MKTTISFLIQEETKRMFAAPVTPDPPKALVNTDGAALKKHAAVPFYEDVSVPYSRGGRGGLPQLPSRLASLLTPTETLPERPSALSALNAYKPTRLVDWDKPRRYFYPCCNV